MPPPCRLCERSEAIHPPLFRHCEGAKRTKQSIELIRILKTAESLKDSNDFNFWIATT